MFRFLLVVAFIIFAILNIYKWNPIIFLISIILLVFALLKYVNNLQKQIQLVTLLSLGLLFTTFDLHSIDWITKYIVIPVIFLVLNSCVIIVSCLFVFICNKYIKS